MSERLKEIKTDVESMHNALNRDDVDGFLDVAENFIDNGYFEHLIEQADRAIKNAEDLEDMDKQLYSTQKRMEELEQLQSDSKMKLLGTIHNLRNRVQELEKELKYAKDIMGLKSPSAYYSKGKNTEREKLKEKNKRYRKALEFYAVSGQGIGEEKHGEVAREALESESE